MKVKLLSVLLLISLLLACSSGILSVAAATAVTEDVSPYIIDENDIPLRLYYDEEASHGVAQGYDDVDTYFGSGSSLIAAHPNDDWERWSIPIGNGYFGANLFGRTETERVQLTEKTLANPYRIVNDSSLPTDGLNNFSETYIDFGHVNSSVTDYSRELDLKTAISTVNYKYNGVNYSREYFTSYPDRALVIKLDASVDGALDFVLRPTVPYEQEYMTNPGDRGGKTGTVVSSCENGVGTIVLSGKLEYFDIDFAGIYKVYTDGTLSATTCTNENGETDGTITVENATSAYIVVTMATDYELSSDTFLASTTSKPTFKTTLADAMAKAEKYMESAAKYSYGQLKERHLQDYTEIFGRVSLDLDCKESDFELTTDELLAQYKKGSGSSYLEALYFQYGRYLLIASSRSGALPANLQGTWNRYNHTPWSSGYWHNINVQMNYWPAFSTNIAETFEAYVEYNKAYMAKAQDGANSIIRQYNNSAYGKDGGNGWSVATGGYVFDVYGSESIGNLGFTTQLFWEYYAYSGDEDLLREKVYPVLVSAARFITKMVKEDANGNYIAIHSDSPEQYVNGVWYFTGEGTGYAQSFAYQNNYNLLLAAKELGIDVTDTTNEDYAILNTVLKQIDKYDPVRVGYSGQVKEFYEEDYYGDLGEYTHRHISQLVGLYPGNVINGTTPAWIDAAKYTLTERGDNATGWGVAHRLNLWARVQDGERSYDLLEQLLKVNTATNLWDLHPPFQIDGNLGGTSGISEMLLQSHANYVEPLAAIPSTWANGSYTGLVARGNFEVSAAWADGLATSFNILSKNGGELSVKYSGIENATVTDSKGKAVEYSVSGTDIITFDTEKGETYIIWGFTAKKTPQAVKNLTLKTDVLAPSYLSWSASDEAVAYNVYVAKEDAPTYTLLTTTTDTAYTYDRPAGENARLTFAVTAIGSDGSESARALVYRVPDDLSAPVLDANARIVNGELQVVIKSNEYSSKYRLYSKASATGTWTLVSESSYPVIIENTYDKEIIYGVSVINRMGEESEITKVTVYTTSTDVEDFNSANILEGTVFVPSADGNSYKHASASYGDYGKLTDGDLSASTGRFSTKGTLSDVLEATVALPAKFILGELKLYDFNGSSTEALYMGQHLKVEVYCDGTWTTVKECSSNAEILALRKSDANGNYISIDLSSYKGQIIRIRLDTTINDTEIRSLSLNEIQCTGISIGSGVVSHENVFDGYVFSATDPSMNSEWKAYKYITDGLVGWSDPGRFATISGKPADATLDFGGKVYILSELDIEYTMANLCGRDLCVYVYRNGVWTKVVDKVYDTGVSRITYNLNDIEAEKIRFTVSGQRSDANYIGISEMKCTGYEITGATVPTDNILLGTTKEQITLSGATVHPSVPNLDFAFDGNLSTRYAVKDAAPYTYSLEIDLDDTYQLYVMSFYPFFNKGETSRSDDTMIEVFYNNVWTTVVTGFTIEPSYCSSVSLGGAMASKIRITFKNTKSSQNATIYEIECTGISAGNLAVQEDLNSNVLANRTEDQLVLNGGTLHPGAGPITSAFDGDKTGSSSRFAILGTPEYFSVEIALNDPAPLYTMAFYPFYLGDTTSRSDNTKIEVYADGVWITVVTGLEIAPTAEPTIASLGGVVAEKVRITFANKSGTTNASIFEITCTTSVSDIADRKPLLEAYKKLEATEIDGLAASEVKKSALTAMKELLMDTKADKKTIDSYIEAINILVEKSNAGFKTTEHGDFASYNLELSNKVGLRLYLDLINAPEGSYVIIKYKDGTLHRVCLSELTTDKSGRYVLSIALPDGSVADEITVAIVFGDFTSTSETLVSVKNYAETIIASTKYDEDYPDVKKLANAILNSEYEIKMQNTATPELRLYKSYHDYTSESQRHPAVDPTYTSAGNVEYYSCTGCDKLYVKNGDEFVEVSADEVFIPAIECTEHDYVDGVCTKCGDHTCTGGEATCIKKAICSICGEMYGSLGEHVTVVIPGKAPTCTETGLTDGEKCSVCGDITVPQSVIEEIAHTEVVDAGIAPTCTGNGLSEGRHCSVCNRITVPQEILDPTGHTEVTDEAVAPTCTESGLTEGKHCSACGKVLIAQTVVDAIGHTEAITDAKAPTCSETGLTEGKHCSACNEVLVPQETVEKLAHTEVTDEAVAPTCAETGLTEGKHCSVCGEVTAAQDTVDALGHNWVSATTEAPRTCLDCGATEGEKLPELTPDPDSTPDPDPDPDPDDEEEKEMSIFERIWQAILDFFNKIVEFFKGFSKDSNKDK